jgi:hypothetical protein
LYITLHTDVPDHADELNEAFFGADWRAPSDVKGNISAVVHVPCKEAIN